jgi:hypothetical protein
MNPLIKCTNWEIKEKEKFTFVSYSYLHYDAEDLCRYDCIEGDLDFCRNLLKLNIFKCKLLLEFGNEVEVLVIPYIQEHKVHSLICLCTDKEGIKNALMEYGLLSKKYIDTCIEESEKIYLFEKYPHIQELIKQYNYAR